MILILKSSLHRHVHSRYLPLIVVVLLLLPMHAHSKTVVLLDIIYSISHYPLWASSSVYLILELTPLQASLPWDLSFNHRVGVEE